MFWQFLNLRCQKSREKNNLLTTNAEVPKSIDIDIEIGKVSLHDSQTVLKSIQAVYALPDVIQWDGDSYKFTKAYRTMPNEQNDLLDAIEKAIGYHVDKNMTADQIDLIATGYAKEAIACLQAAPLTSSQSEEPDPFPGYSAEDWDFPKQFATM
eukprot:GHVU01127437.1.p1 GENE.GHVU01127437.1~~GHVU01127437.1.p1  ORF type:complete len:154 (-),score=22.42 GHVU01127437.1:78-539(-)